MSNAARNEAFSKLYAEYAALPEGTLAEIASGAVRVLPRPQPIHVRAASVIGARLLRSFGWDSDDGPGGWVILHEPELRMGDEIRVPDLAGWKVERYKEPERNPIELVPDWICEVLSPSTAHVDRVEKMPLYAEHGVAFLWIVDPVMKTIEVYRRDGKLWVVDSNHGADEQARPAPFGEVPFDVAALWRVPGSRC